MEQTGCTQQGKHTVGDVEREGIPVWGQEGSPAAAAEGGQTGRHTGRHTVHTRLCCLLGAAVGAVGW